MNSEILNKLQLGDIDPAYFIIGLLVLFIAILVYTVLTASKLNKLTKKYEKFMKGKDGKSLENVIGKRFSQIDSLIQKDKEKDIIISDIKDNLQIAFQKVGIVKYDAFSEMGGKLSFAIALLNKDNNGYVINAMHSREGCYTYIKEIIKGESYIILGEEEKQAVDKAVNFDNYME